MNDDHITIPPQGLAVSGERQHPIDQGITFHAMNKEILRLDEKGMTYKGVLIEDAGEAHRAFIETCGQIISARNQQPTEP